MRFASLDFEMNQPSGKIIQIGAVSVDSKTGRFLSEFNELVRIDEALDPFITDLTGITEEDLATGVSLHTALVNFWKWHSEHSSNLLGGWGKDAFDMVRISEEDGMILPWKLRAVDFMTTVQLLRSGYVGRRQKSGLQGALDMLGLEFIGQHHNALDDAKNAARVVCEFIRRISAYHSVEQMICNQTAYVYDE